MTVAVEKQLSDTYLCMTVPLGYSSAIKTTRCGTTALNFKLWRKLRLREFWRPCHSCHLQKPEMLMKSSGLVIIVQWPRVQGCVENS